MRGLVMLGILAGAGWYAYRKLMGSANRNTSTVTDRLPQPVRHAVTTATEKVRAAASGNQRSRDEMHSDTGSPAETRAAMMAGMPAVQPPATIPGS